MNLEVAKRILVAAEKKGGSVFVTDVQPGDTEHGLQHGWLAPVGIGHFEITEAGRLAGMSS